MKFLPIQLVRIFSRKDAVMRNGRFLENIVRAYLQFAFSAAFHFAFCVFARRPRGSEGGHGQKVGLLVLSWRRKFRRGEIMLVRG
jgi:hypothetical protein